MHAAAAAYIFTLTLRNALWCILMFHQYFFKKLHRQITDTQKNNDDNCTKYDDNDDYESKNMMIDERSTSDRRAIEYERRLISVRAQKQCS